VLQDREKQNSLKKLDSGSVIPDLIRDRNDKNRIMRGFNNYDSVSESWGFARLNAVLSRPVKQHLLRVNG
jgi:hypothetical protein